MPKGLASERYFSQHGANGANGDPRARAAGRPQGRPSPNRPTPPRPSGLPANADPRRLLLDEVQAARILGVSHRTLQRWRHRGGGPVFVKLGPQAVRYRLSDLDQYVEQSLRRSTSDPGPDAA